MFRFEINNNSTHSLHIRTFNLDKLCQNYALLFWRVYIKFSDIEL